MSNRSIGSLAEVVKLSEESDQKKLKEKMDDAAAAVDAGAGRGCESRYYR